MCKYIYHMSIYRFSKNHKNQFLGKPAVLENSFKNLSVRMSFYHAF